MERAIVSGRRRNGTPRTVTARVMSILSAFSKEHPILGLPEISRRTGLSSSTAHRLAAELTDWGALARTSDFRYRIGPTLLRLGEISHGHPQPADLHRESRTGNSGVVDNE
jgi:DNA-binding IclR family transcriptional regulator